MNGVQLTSWQALRAGIISTTKAMLKWLVTNPAGWAIIATASIATLVKIVDELGVTVEEQRESLENLKQEYSEITSELQACNEELKTTEQRMRELEKIESPTFAEKEEYDNLVKTNNELQRKIDLLELEEKIKSQEARDAFVSTMEKDTDRTKDNSDKYFYYIDPNDPNQQKSLGKGSTVTYSMGGFSIQAVPEDELIDVYENYANRLKELDEQYANDLENETYKETKTTIEQEMADLANYLADKSNQWSSDANGIKYIQNPTTEDDKAVNEWLDYIANFQDRMSIAMGGDNAKTNTFNRVVNNWQFDETVQGLQDLGKEGKVTAEMLNDPKYDEFINKLVFLGVIDSADNLEDVALAFNSVADSAENAADSASQYVNEITVSLGIKDTITQLNTQLKPAMDSLADAWGEIFSGENGEMNLDNIDLLSITEAIQSELDKLNDPNGLNLEIDYSSYEEFVRVLEDTASTEEDVRNAFDGLADSITSGLSGFEDFKTVKEALLDLGVINNEVVAFDALINKTELLKEANIDLSTASGETIKEFAGQYVSANQLTDAIIMLTAQKLLYNLQEMNSTNEVANLKELAENAGYTGEVIKYLTELEQIYQNVASGVYGTNTQQVAMAKERARQLLNLIQESATKVNYEPEIDYSGAKKSASAGGKDAGDAYVEAFEEELQNLKDLRDQGVISEKEYLDRYRALYEKYFKDIDGYAKEFADNQKQYLDGMLSLYNSALSGISKLMDSKIDSYQESKEVAIESLEAEKEAAEEAYQAQIDAIDDVIEEKEKIIEGIEDEIDAIEDIIDGYNEQIDAINDEIDAMREANNERQRAIDLQKAQYELERMQSQRTQLVN